MIFHQLEVKARERGSGRLLTGDEITLTLRSPIEKFPLEYDAVQEAFVISGLRPGEYVLELEAEKYEHLALPLQVDPAPTQVVVEVSLAQTEAFEMAVPDAAAEIAKQGLIGILPKRSGATGEDVEKRIRKLADENRLRPPDAAPASAFELYMLPGPAGSEAARSALEAVRADSEVAAAGPYEDRSIVTNRLYVRFELGVPRSRIDQLLSKHKLAPEPTRLPAGPNLFEVMAPNLTERRDMDVLVRELEKEADVAHAEIVLIEESEPDGQASGEYFNPVWDRELIEVSAAQALAAGFSPGPLVAVFDQALDGEIESHPDFADGRQRLKLIQGFEGACKSGSFSSDSDHGLMCAGMVASRFIGAAPESRVLLIEDPEDPTEHVHAYLWAAGLGEPPGDPGRRERPEAEIFSCCRRRSLTENARFMLRKLTRLGRKGKGCVLFFSAGTYGTPESLAEAKPLEVSQGRPYGALPYTLSIAASTLNHQGLETFASYSGWGRVELCAPSGTWHGLDDVGEKYSRVCGPARAHHGTYPAQPLISTRTLKQSAKGMKTLYVEARAGWAANTHVAVLLPTGDWLVARLKRKVDGDPQILGVGKLAQDVPAGSLVISGSQWIADTTMRLIGETSKYWQTVTFEDRLARVLVGRAGEGTFGALSVESLGVGIGQHESAPADDKRKLLIDTSHRGLYAGTSTATPLCAGVAALMLQVNPHLTWVEVRHLLRKTAVKIDRDCQDEVGRWVDRLGRHNSVDPYFSRRYGFGRVNARAAVEAAVQYVLPRDLWIRRTDDDDGLRQLEGKPDSPDIWVRSLDPLRMPLEELENADLHEPALRGQTHWVFARIRNRGPEESLEAWVRFYVAAGKDRVFSFPEDFEDEGPAAEPGVWKRASYFLGEVAIAGVPADGSQVGYVCWRSGLLPPAADNANRPWDPHILVEITPFDGALKGSTVLDNSNMAQRAVEIRDP